MSVIIGILVIVVLALVIIQMVGGTKTKITYQFEPPPGMPPPLPAKTPAEVKAMMEAMPRKWVTYAGATPPLKLHLRGQTYEGLRRVTRKMIDETIGQAVLDMMPLDQATNYVTGPRMIAGAYVIDWEGAVYPNGAAMPFSISNMTTRLAEDPYLMTFVTDEAHRLSPAGRLTQVAFEN